MHYFKDKIAGWGNFPWIESKIFPVRNSSEIKEVIFKEEKNISRGLGRSYGDQAVNEGRSVILTNRLNHFLGFDSKTGLLECEAGVSLADIIQTFAPKGWFPMINPGTKNVTVGGAIANDIHGKAHHVDGSFVNCVRDFSILLADGTIKTVSRQENQELFRANFGGLGLLGVILKATIQLRRIETTFFTQKTIKVKCLDELLATFEQNDDSYAYSVAWIDSLATGKNLGRGVFTAGNAASLEDLPPKLKKNPLQLSSDPKLSLPVYLPHFALNNFTVGILNKVLETVQSSGRPIVHYGSFFFPLDAVNQWNRAYGKNGFIQYQFVIPLENGQKNIRAILEKIAQSGNAPFLNVLKKFGEGEPESPLSFPMKGYTFAIDFPLRKGLKKLSQELDKMVLDFGGRIYLGKDAMLDKASFQAMYPNYTDWLKVKQKYDPENKFSSNLSRRLGLENELEMKISEPLTF